MKGEKKQFDSDKIISIAILVLICILAVMAATIIGIIIASAIHSFRVSSPPADEPAEGVARVPAVARYLDGAEEAEYISLEEYREGDGPAPEWYRPDEPMAAEWEDSNTQQSNGHSDTVDYIERHDIGCPNWNLCSTLYGWDGHTAEPWELELYARITYLEFWGTSPECCEAGADSILQLWDSGYYGDTLGDLLTARAEDGSLVYSPFAYVWEWDYDPEGLADMRTLCEDRYYNGPEWPAPFFRLWYYHPWAEPMYEIDGVYFSTGWGW